MDLDRYVRDYKIFIDTCSIMASVEFEKFIALIAPLMKANNRQFVISLSVVKELEKLKNNDEDNATRDSANKGLEILAKLQKDKLIDLRGNENDGVFADKVFDYVFSMLKDRENLCLITQDNNLAKMILSKNNQEAYIGKKIICKRIKNDGTLGSFRFETEAKTSLKPQNSKKVDCNTTKIEKFKLCTRVTSTPDSKMQVSDVPKEGDYVLVQGGSIRLIKEHAKGGEGSVFETNTQYVAKIYIKEKITQRRYEKIKLMLEKGLECKGICYPVAMIYNQQNEFVGYLMPRAKGVELGKSIFKKPLFEKKLPNWNRKNLAELCVSILEKIDYLHERNIILGDINPANILVVSPKEVYFVDTDSYQIENFPCPVGTDNFTASEIQSEKFDTFLRTMGNEYFAIATLLFMIIVPGKPPYSQQDGASASENIRNASFPYPLGDSSTGKVPDGAWRFMWSHLPRKAIKEAFYESFQKGGAYFTESKRLNTKEWLKRFREYVRLFEEGKLQEQDSMSLDIYPTRYKKQQGVKYIICKDCGIEKQEKYTKNGLCCDCINISKKLKEEVHSTSICKTCMNSFDITKGEHDYYVKKGLSMPKRCVNCRGNSYVSSNTSQTLHNSYNTGFKDFLKKLFG